MQSRTVALTFSCLGHLYVHLFTAVYFVIVLALEREWALPYHELVELWTLGALMVGVAALPAGWLGDRWSATAMMVVYFLGVGGCSILAGLAGSPLTLLLALTGIGTFAAIYHPVGIPWLIRNAGERTGKLLGFNGIFGSLGTAVAAVCAGFLIDSLSWRAAFIVPGVVCFVTGVALAHYARKGVVGDVDLEANDQPAPSRNDRLRVFSVLLITMFIAAIVYHSTQSALPKTLEIRRDAWLGQGVLGVGALVAVIYTAAGFMQVLGGHFADRLPLKRVYLGLMAVQVPLLWWAASVSGLPLVMIATLMVMAAAAALPAENMLLARYTPRHRHGLVFGIKFVLAFGAGPLAIQFVATVNRQTGEFHWVFFSLAGLVAVAAVCALMLPQRGPARMVAHAAAE